jgi:CPA1 family monovalent cation:H+ antiporter
VALASIEDQHGPEAENLRYRFSLKTRTRVDRASLVPLDRLRDLGLNAIRAERAELEHLRNEDKVGSDDYLGLQEQLDWSELTLLRDADRQIEEI